MATRTQKVVRRGKGRRTVVDSAYDRNLFRENNAGEFPESIQYGRSLSADRGRRIKTRARGSSGNRAERKIRGSKKT